MFLCVVKSAMPCLVRFSKILDVEKLLLNNITINIESLTKSGIEFMPKETTKADKMAGWIATD